MATPLKIAIQASNGASDYGNKFGEPLITGFVRSFGLRLPSGERREWVKPIMFSGGIGSIDADLTSKQAAEPSMNILKSFYAKIQNGLNMSNSDKDFQLIIQP